MLYIVGIGPGDPELLTLKAVRLLGESEAVAFADPRSGTNPVTKMLRDLMRGKSLVPLYLSKEPTPEQKRRAAIRLLEALKGYASVVYPVLGDPGQDDTAQYLLEQIGPRHPCQVIPGILK